MANQYWLGCKREGQVAGIIDDENYVRVQVLAAASMKMAVFWVIAPP
jgi:hypothetical protein